MKEIEHEISKVKILSISFLIFTPILFGLTAICYHNNPNPVWPERGAMYFMFGLDFVSYIMSLYFITQYVYLKIRLNRIKKEQLVTEILQI